MTENTYFEQFAAELGVPITTDDYGLYTGHIRALANIYTDVIMNDPMTLGLEWEEIKPIVEAEFFSKFPYMRK